MLNQQNIQHGVKHDYLHRGGNHDLFPYFSVVPCFVLTKTLIVNGSLHNNIIIRQKDINNSILYSFEFTILQSFLS